MLQNIFTFMAIIFISFMPIVAWAYIFSYVDDTPLNKKRFFAGILGGVLSVFPILYMEKISYFFSLPYLNTFGFIENIKSFFGAINFGLSLSFFLLFIALTSFIFFIFIHKIFPILKVYIKNIIVFLIFICFISIIFYFLNFFFQIRPEANFSISEGANFSGIIFNSFKLIIFYYVVVAFIEESAKHFNFLQSSFLYIDSPKTAVKYAIFVALGFSFVENILYLYVSYSSFGLSGELAKTYFFRSVFSVMVHVLSSSFIAYYFGKALILYRDKDLSFPYLKIFLFGLFWGIFLHFFFDLAITLGLTFVIIVYFIGGYLYVSSIFYKE